MNSKKGGGVLPQKLFSFPTPPFPLYTPSITPKSKVWSSPYFIFSHQRDNMYLQGVIPHMKLNSYFHIS